MLNIKFFELVHCLNGFVPGGAQAGEVSINLTANNHSEDQHYHKRRGTAFELVFRELCAEDGSNDGTN